MTHEYFMLQAIKEARKAYEAEEVPVGAVIVMGDKIIARGYNQVEKLVDPTAHAEILALTSAYNFLGSKYLPEAHVYVTIEPCMMCAGALYWTKIGKVTYGAEDEKNGYRKFCKCPPSINGLHLAPLPFHPKTEVFKDVLKEECAELIKSFFKQKR